MFPKKLGMGYHNTSHPEFLDDASEHRAKGRAKYNDISKQEFAPDRVTSDPLPKSMEATNRPIPIRTP